MKSPWKSLCVLATITTTLVPASYAGAGAPPAATHALSGGHRAIGFGQAVQYPVEGVSPVSVVSADFNGDRVRDLATADRSSESVSILLGWGDGTFKSAGTTGLGGSNRGVKYIAAADFNGDGNVDVATANEYSRDVSVLLGNGDGSFAAVTDYAVAGGPYSVTTGDLNGDGNPDLIAGTSGNVSVLLGLGDGTFETAVDYPAGDHPWSVVAADLNGDGATDLAAGNYGSNDVSILLGKGDGTFAPAGSYPVATYPWSIASADLNGDGNADLALANGSYTADVSVLLGKGDGTFRRASSFATPDAPARSIRIDDFNRDGHPDLAVGHLEGARISVLPGRGDGTFGKAVTVETRTSGRVASADFNGDRRPDLATANLDESSVEVLLNTGEPSVCKGTPSPPPASLHFAGSWTAQPEGDLNSLHSDATQTVLKDGRILLVGGVLGEGGPQPAPYATAEVYDPATGKWTRTGRTIEGRYWHSATLLRDGKVLVAGGFGTDTAEIYDPATNKWTATGTMVMSQYRDSAVLLPSGKVLVTGGFTGYGDVTNTAELYDPATGTWAPTGDMNSPHSYAINTAVLLKTGKVLIEGGTGSQQAFTAELYDPATGTWAYTGDLNVGRWYHRVTLLPDGKVLVSAGVGLNTSALYAELYDPDTGIWCLTGSLHVGRYTGTATLLPGGRVLVAGGLPFDGSGASATSEAEVWNPATGAWKVTADMNLPRESQIAAPLPNGDVLVAGGGPYAQQARTSEIFHPSTGAQPTP